MPITQELIDQAFSKMSRSYAELARSGEHDDSLRALSGAALLYKVENQIFPQALVEALNVFTDQSFIDGYEPSSQENNLLLMNYHKFAWMVLRFDNPQWRMVLNDIVVNRYDQDTFPNYDKFIEQLYKQDPALDPGKDRRGTIDKLYSGAINKALDSVEPGKSQYRQILQ